MGKVPVQAKDDVDEAMARARREPYVVRVLVRQAVGVDARALMEALGGLGGAVLLDEDPEAPGRIAVSFTDEVGEGDAGGEDDGGGEGSGVHPLGVVDVAEALGADEGMAAAIGQTWDFEGAAEAEPSPRSQAAPAMREVDRSALRRVRGMDQLEEKG